MTPTPMLALALACALSPSARPTETDAPATWVGTVGTNRLALELVDGDAPRVTLYVLNQDAIAFAGASVRVEDGGFEASFPDLGASVHASEGGGALVVEWEQPGFQQSSEFARQDHTPAVVERRRVTELGVNPRAPLATAQFAFLVGEWHGAQKRLGPDGSYIDVGTIDWKGRWVLDGMAVQNTSQSRAPGGQVTQFGMDTRTYNPKKGRWEHRYLDAFQGSFLAIEWTMDEQGVLVSNVVQWVEPGGQLADHVIRFEVIDEDHFRWSSDLSTDGGKTWIPASLVSENRRVR